MDKKYLEMPIDEKLQFLGRMKSDCEYYLGEGRKQSSCLWGQSVDFHLDCMGELLSSIPMEERPKWLTFQNIKDFSEKMDHRMVITAQTLGLYGARFSNLSENRTRHHGEIFFSIKRRIYHNRDEKITFSYDGRDEYGYTAVTPEMKDIFDTLFRDHPENRSIECIEWDDSWNIVFKDGIYISSRQCRMEKSEFANWYRTISPSEEKNHDN